MAPIVAGVAAFVVAVMPYVADVNTGVSAVKGVLALGCVVDELITGVVPVACKGVSLGGGTTNPTAALAPSPPTHAGPFYQRPAR